MDANSTPGRLRANEAISRVETGHLAVGDRDPLTDARALQPLALDEHLQEAIRVDGRLRLAQRERHFPEYFFLRLGCEIENDGILDEDVHDLHGQPLLAAAAYPTWRRFVEDSRFIDSRYFVTVLRAMSMLAPSAFPQSADRTVDAANPRWR